MRKKCSPLFFSMCCLALVVLQGRVFATGLPDFTFNALLDARLVKTDDNIGWLDAGLGKARYGGDSNGEARTLFRFAEASAVIRSRFSLSTAGKLHLKADSEQTQGIDVVESFISYRPVSTSATKIKARAGVFFPPISLENNQLAWTSPYSISSSAINSWVGEELRTLGVEVTATHVIDDEKFSFTGSLFRANDPAGSLLAWRGWAIHDRKSGLSDRLSLAPLPSIENGGSIQEQASWVEPFHEIDQRTGYYAGLDWKHLDVGQLKMMFYDNRADETAFDGDQYAWHTTFISMGGHYEFVNGIELFGQILTGNSIMGRTPNNALVVDIDFQATYLMLSKPIKQHRFSIRYDRFSIDDLDTRIDDDNNEDGWGVTLAYTQKITQSQRLFVEAMHINSDRANRIAVGLQAVTKENTLQLSYRFIF